MPYSSNRGSVIWILASSRPDLIEVDLKRPGRVDVKIPLFPTSTKREGFDLLRMLLKKRSTRLTRPLSTRRSTATLIEPGVRYTFGPIVFTGKGPLFKRASSMRKSVSSIPVSSSPA